MNEEMTQSLSTFVKDSIESLTTTKEFCVEQAPDLIQQILAWKFWQSVSVLLIWTVIVIGYIIYYRYVLRTCKKTKEEQNARSSYHNDPYETPFFICSSMIGAFLGLIYIIVVCVNLYTILQIWIAPKIFLIEYASGLIGKN